MSFRTYYDAQINTGIFAELKHGATDVRALAAALKCAPNTVRARLLQLEAGGMVHRERLPIKGCHYIWHTGPSKQAPGKPVEVSYDDDENDDSPLAKPSQVTTHTYPAIDRRDALQVAFWGAPKRRKDDLLDGEH